MSENEKTIPGKIEKNIFKYWNGFEEVYADPFEIDMKFQEASELESVEAYWKWINDYAILVKKYEDESSEKEKTEDVMKFEVGEFNSAQQLYFKAQYNLIPIIRKSFDIKPFDKATGEGMSSDQIIDMYGSYLEWKFDLKKNTDSPPISVVPTDLISPTSTESLPTNQDTGSISTKSAVRR